MELLNYNHIKEKKKRHNKNITYYNSINPTPFKLKRIQKKKEEKKRT